MFIKASIQGTSQLTRKTGSPLPPPWPGIGTSPHTSTIYQTELKIVSELGDVFINCAREHMLCYVTTLSNT